MTTIPYSYIRKLAKKLPCIPFVPEGHQLRIARQTLRLSDAGARIMGGMTKDEARLLLQRRGYSKRRKTNKKAKPGPSQPA